MRRQPTADSCPDAFAMGRWFGWFDDPLTPLGDVGECARRLAPLEPSRASLGQHGAAVLFFFLRKSRPKVIEIQGLCAIMLGSAARGTRFAYSVVACGSANH